jgi:CRP-like cAMP-binding protein
MAGAPIETLRRVPLFEDLSADELEQVSLLFKERRFPAGETVVKEGSDGATFYVIEEGDAIVSVAGREVARLSAGDFFGEIALLDEDVRSATITAVDDLVCFGLTLWEFQPLVVANGSIGWKLAHSLARKLRVAQLGSDPPDPTAPA